MRSSSQNSPLVDAHCHLSSYDYEVARNFGDVLICAVSEDLESSERTIEYCRSLSNALPFVGLHPWNIDQRTLETMDRILLLAERSEVAGIGEVGIDRRLATAGLDVQLEVYRRFCQVAAELDLPLNVHALDAWDLALREALRMGVRRVMIHWYTGPIGLLKDIEGAGYFISINPSVKVQRRHLEVLRHADMNMILTESDGPYNYRGLELGPTMLNDSIRLIAEVKDLTVAEVARSIFLNLLRYFDVKRSSFHLHKHLSKYINGVINLEK